MENFSGKILSCYEQHALELPLRKLGPFFLRAYKMTADKKYYNILAWHLFCIVIPRFLLLHEKALQKDFSLPKNLKKYTGTPKNMRAVKRSLFYKNNPSVEFLDLFTEYLFSIKRYGLYKTILKKEYNQAIGVLREVNFKNIYITPSSVRYNSSFAVNTIFFLRSLSVHSLTNDLVALFRKMYFTKEGELQKTLPRWELQSLLYSMTHIIIAHSHYYERRVQTYFWILDFFSKNITNILQNSTLDIIAEVGLCYRLCGRENEHKQSFEKITRHIKKNFASRDLPNHSFLVKKYHTNYIIMLLFAKNICYARGPLLSSHPIIKSFQPK